MRSQTVTRFILTATCLLGAAASAGAQQIANFSIGGFVPRAQDARIDQDVLVENSTFLTFNIKDFDGLTYGGEYIAPLGPFFEVSGGVSFYQKTVPSVYTDFVNTNGSEIAQDLKLRMIPFSAAIRMTPFGNDKGVQPYFGAGVQIVNWRYTESGAGHSAQIVCGTHR